MRTHGSKSRLRTNQTRRRWWVELLYTRVAKSDCDFQHPCRPAGPWATQRGSPSAFHPKATSSGNKWPCALWMALKRDPSFFFSFLMKRANYHDPQRSRWGLIYGSREFGKAEEAENKPVKAVIWNHFISRPVSSPLTHALCEEDEGRWLKDELSFGPPVASCSLHQRIAQRASFSSALSKNSMCAPTVKWEIFG